ncbi:HDOD domain-containing protein [Photobacterium sp. ZSDE20]|uniref:HDOD domain-containing protein n=1 Tax=Photobacterium pectinilyticum TaxID=2906793 RepID=A0ABT1N7C3_9GAMM|nr:HDOD domain-containing protein [Photobacterium sp. ZSDE20]MCQ1060645.1 HDOD domain-containing protein [Photobacterium sp. ZSDE20]MDD1828167.1 HDOD domain-containing protein [Photobacterium sp. ZSDE20]
MTHVSFFWLKPENDKIIKGLESEFCSLVKSAVQKDRLILPPIPSVLSKLQQLCNNDETTVRDVADLLIDDPGITAYIVKISNTMMFNRRNVVCHDIYNAVSRLGIFRVRDIITAKAIEELKLRYHFSKECNQLLKQSAIRSRQLAATMALISHGLANHEEFPKELEPEKALLAGLFADIGLFSLIHEYQSYLDSGNYLDIDIAKYVFQHSCQEASKVILKHWGFDDDYLEVATNQPLKHPTLSDNTGYLDVARMAHHLLMFKSNDDAIDEHHVELDLAGAEVMYELTNLPAKEFNLRLKMVISNSGL